ncbi:M20 family peptidase [Vibrio sp. DW001]|uniref:M20 family peptidase n=1 Tax=Vibrio sp. DW001 TaxID=2912315 RepID=UPI0023B1FBC1|nr:M20 family peptidase [Vibrio sp. DW001]WED25199.1 M20 family peptidase [Vibrio sp. DW001]
MFPKKIATLCKIALLGSSLFAPSAMAQGTEGHINALEAAQRLSVGIQYPTISNQDRSDFDSEAFTGYHAYLEKTYPLLHKTLKKEVLGAGREYSLLYTWEGQNKELPLIVLMGHQDVVPVVPGTEKDWEYDAYSGHIDDKYIWGRGSLDDKIMIHAIMEAIEMQLAEGFRPERTIYLSFGQDEEVGGPEGTKHIVEVLQERGINEVALVVDEGLPVTAGIFPGFDKPAALLGIAEKGYLTLELKVEGPGGHSAMPPEESNIGILSNAIAKLESNPFPVSLTDSVREQFKAMAPHMTEEQRKVLKDDDSLLEYLYSNPITRAMIHTTTAVTVVDGGVKENVMAPSADALVNFRILQGDSIESVTEYVSNVINDERVTITDNPASINPSPIAGTGAEYQMIEKTIHQTWNEQDDLAVVPYLVIGGADAKWFAATDMVNNVYRFTAVRVESAADAARWHGVNERVLIDEYANSIQFFHNLLNNMQEM